MNDLGRMLVGLGLLLVMIGGAVMLAGKLGMGRLPGDIVYRKGNFTLYVPIATSILLSIVLTLILRLLSRR